MSVSLGTPISPATISSSSPWRDLAGTAAAVRVTGQSHAADVGRLRRAHARPGDRSPTLRRGGVWAPGGLPDLQNQCDRVSRSSGFDSRPPPPSAPAARTPARARKVVRPCTTDPRRAVPQTDSVLADARLAEPQRRLGRRRVRDAVHASQERVRAGSLSPEQLDRRRAPRPACARHDAHAGHQRDGNGAAHQPRSRSALRRGSRRADRRAGLRRRRVRPRRRPPRARGRGVARRAAQRRCPTPATSWW